MKKYTEEELKGKFVIAFDTFCEGHQCVMEGDEDSNNYGPMLYSSHDEAMRELFTDALSKFENMTKEEWEEFKAENVNSDELLARMKEVSKIDNPNLMDTFLSANPEFNDNGEWVEPASTFIMNRKIVFGNEGFKITGTKL